MKIITNTLGVGNYKHINYKDANTVVVVNAKNPTIGLLRIEEGEDEDEAVKSYLAQITLGCNYRYEIVKKIGNTYFCN